MERSYHGTSAAIEAPTNSTLYNTLADVEQSLARAIEAAEAITDKLNGAVPRSIGKEESHAPGMFQTVGRVRNNLDVLNRSLSEISERLG